MNSGNKPNFLSQPVVKNIFVYRNGDPYYEARRVVLNHKRVNNFETFLRDVTGGVQAPFGAVRNIYTPRGGHKVDSLELLQSGEQYVAAGREKFKKLDYLHISSRKKRTLQSIATQVKPVHQNRLIVSARFLKPMKEPCTIFVVVNGDVLDPALRLLIPRRVLGQFEKILDMITERIGYRILGGVRSLYTFEGQQVMDGKQLESGQFFVACGREKFKKLPYQDLLFTKPRGVRRIVGARAATLPPIYRFSKQNGMQSKSQARSSDSAESKASPPPGGHVKEHLSSIVREISQARLISLRRKRSRMSMSLGYPDNVTLGPQTGVPVTLGPQTGVPVTLGPQTGVPVTLGPQTGVPVTLGPQTGVPVTLGPQTGVPVTLGPQTGVPVTLGPQTGVPVTLGPQTGVPVTLGPQTGVPVTLGPQTGVPVTLGPQTGVPVTLGPQTGVPVTLGPQTGVPVTLGPQTGVPVTLGPQTGVPVTLGPQTGVPVTLGPQTRPQRTVQRGEVREETRGDQGAGGE
ncbi:doublecortin domain-containing protein 2-like [Aplochiton taeniatus]